jgi:peptide/nickel transport system permease protein
MVWYGLRRIAYGSLVLVAAVGMMFWFIYVVPGDPASVILGPRADEAHRVALRAEMGLDKPVALQFARFVERLSVGDLGKDVMTQEPIARLIAHVLPATLALTFAGLGWALILGVPIGCWCAMHRDSWGDRLVGIVSMATLALPTTILGIYALLLFAVTLHWLPAIGLGSGVGDKLRHLLLPALTLGLGWVGYLIRAVRASMLDVLQENHVRTFRAFGVPEPRLALRYLLKITIAPVIAVVAIGMGSLLSNAVIIEIIFLRPGIGRLAYEAVLQRNFPIVLGAVLIAAVFYLVCSIVAELLIASLDPRVRSAL